MLPDTLCSSSYNNDIYSFCKIMPVIVVTSQSCCTRLTKGPFLPSWHILHPAASLLGSPALPWCRDVLQHTAVNKRSVRTVHPTGDTASGWGSLSSQAGQHYCARHDTTAPMLPLLHLPSRGGDDWGPHLVTQLQIWQSSFWQVLYKPLGKTALNLHRVTSCTGGLYNFTGSCS